ncbi:hypothetical protein NESM_000428600 [Novymonas esmeraldas]|uniref:FHA domain-containing protein n=1 Tax=Novymonas esmeraldas TaxID=1808958 RepID=A0AAW0ELK1_9TRYP
MSQTDFFVAVSGNAERAGRFGEHCRFRSDDEPRLIKDVIQDGSESLLLLAFVEDSGIGKALCKAMFSFFAESVKSPEEVYTQFKVSFVEEKANDLIQYRCERLGDIDAVVEAENGAHACCSICATNVVPQESSFAFVEQRLTVVVCCAADYTAESLLRLTDDAAAMVGCRVTSVGLYVPKKTMCGSVDLDLLAAAARVLQERLASHSVGKEERVSSRVRLQDVRAWSLMINERHHFSPVEAGPYFISLNPRLVVGEKLAHHIHEDRTYIVGEGTNASPVDFCVMPTLADGDALHRSVYSPHCRVRREAAAVWLKPECGMTYVNGKLIAEETPLQPNDRIILGKQLAFRFVVVGQEPPTTRESRILDWELCSKEFRQESARVVERGTVAALERDNVDLRGRCDDLEAQLQHARGDSWVMLTNPPPGYRGTLLWPLDLRKRHSQVTIGPQGDVQLPFLSNTAVIKHAMDGLVFKCGGATIPLTHGSRFTVGSTTFAISLDESVAPGRVRKEEKQDVRESPDAMLEMQSSFFSLQWSVGALFDFVFPVKGRKVRRDEDNYVDHRSSLYDTRVLESAAMRAADVAALNARLTAAVRLIGAGLARELREHSAPAASATAVVSPRHDTAPATGAAAEEFLRQTLGSNAALSAAVLKRLHEDIGAVLVERCTGRAAAAAAAATPKTPRSQVKERQRDSAGPVPLSSPLSVEERLLQLKGTCFLASSAVVRRASSTVDLLNLSTSAKTLWERHVQHVGTMGKSFSEKKGEDASLLVELLLIIVDAVLSTDFCIRRHLLSQAEVDGMEEQLGQWQRWAEKCVGALGSQMQSSRGTWKHEATVQRTPTPQIRRSMGTPRADTRLFDRPAAPSGNGSRKSSLSRTTPSQTSAPPRITGALSGGRSLLSTSYTGKTPQNLSSFAAVRKASVSSAASAAVGGRPPPRTLSPPPPPSQSNGAKKRSLSAGSRITTTAATATTTSGRRKAEHSARSGRK